MLSVELSAHCIRNGRCYDLPRAKDFLRSYACSLFDFLLSAYKETIRTYEWESDIANETVQIVLACWDHFGVSPSSETWIPILQSAIRQHVGRPLGGIMKQPIPPTSPAAIPPEQGKQSPSLGALLKRTLTEARIRPEDIAEEIGIEPRNVYRHLSGETTPSIPNIGKYEKALSKHLGRQVRFPTPVKRQ
jgi:hypothetical protein